MKNVLLMIVLGLFTTGCLEKGWNNPIGPIGGTGCDVGNCETFECPATGYIYDDEDFCEQVCSEECIDS